MGIYSDGVLSLDTLESGNKKKIFTERDVVQDRV